MSGGSATSSDNMDTDNIRTDNRGTDNIRRDEEWVVGGIFHLVSFNFICSHCDKIKTRKISCSY